MSLKHAFKKYATRVGDKFVFIVYFDEVIRLSFCFFGSWRDSGLIAERTLFSAFIPLGDGLTRNEVNRVVREEIRDNDFSIKVIC